MRIDFIKLLCLLICLPFIGKILAQNKSDSTSSIIFAHFEYSYLFPAGDFEDRYGNTNQVGGGFAYKLANNWQFGLKGNALFSNNVKTKGLLDNVINAAGDATDSEGELVKINYEMRGFSIFSSIGRVLNVGNGSRDNGLLVEAGVGFIQHRIKIDYRDGDVFQLSDEAVKGYDRLSNGIAFRQGLSYQYFGPKNLMNFYIGFEVMQAITKNRREYNYDTQSFDKEPKFDVLYGFRAGWMIPFRKRASEEFYYY